MRCLLILFFLAASLSEVYGQGVLSLRDTTRYEFPSDFMRYFASKTGEEDLRLISDSLFVEKNFKTLVPLTDTVKYIWAVIDIVNEASFDDWLFGTSENDVRVYFRQNGKFVEKKIGMNTTFSEKEYTLSRKFFKISFNHSRQRLFVKVKIRDCACYNIERYEFYGRVWNGKMLEQRLLRNLILDSSKLAGLICIAIFNFFIYLITRSKSYLLYLLTLFFSVGYFFSRSYFTTDFAYIFDSAFGNVLGNLSISLTVACYLLFVLAFFKSDGKDLVSRVLIAAIVWQLCIAGYSLFLMMTNPANLSNIIVHTSNAAYAIEVFLVIIYSVKKFREKVPAAKSFFFANILPLTFIASVVTYAAVRLDFNENTFEYVTFGIVFQMLLFSVALADRFNAIKKDVAQKELEKEQLAKEKALEMQNLIAQKNVELEHKVAERTQEINEKNEELHQIIEELDVTNEKLKETFENLEAQHLQIKDSILYAENIQRAILPKNEKVHSTFPEFFAFFKPRDIVSGDFYWFAEPAPGISLLGVFDCTGHGVPGAFMSLISYQILNEIVFIKQISSPEQILLNLHKGIVQSLRQKDTNNKDGLDAALLMYDGENIAFSGAKNPLYYCEGGEIFEIKGDNMHIGGEADRENVAHFQLHIVPKSDKKRFFFLSSDGMQDQFGGEKGKKLMKKNFVKLLTDTALQPESERVQFLDNFLRKWRGKEEQTDDILIAGFSL
jgi:serine phosphatase RsbU (regulator of sigma subunit)